MKARPTAYNGSHPYDQIYKEAFLKDESVPNGHFDNLYQTFTLMARPTQRLF